MQLNIFQIKKSVLKIEWDVISFDWSATNGDYCIIHYWRSNFTAKQWKALKTYAKRRLKKTV